MTNTPSTIPPPTTPIVMVSTHQVWSAAAQNIVVALCVTAGWLADKLGTELAVIALLGIVGIDFAGRKKLPSGASAVAIGATGMGALVSKYPWISAVFAALLAASGCSLFGGPPKSAKDVVDDVRVVLDQGLFACTVLPDLPPDAARACELILAAAKQLEGIDTDSTSPARSRSSRSIELDDAGTP